MVGGFVEEKQIGFTDQAAGEIDAALHPCRKDFKLGVGVKLHAGDDLVNLVLTLPLMLVIERRRDRFESAGDDIGDASAEILRYFLRQIRHTDALLAGDGSFMRQDIAVDQLQQRGLAHAVAPEQADAFSAFDL